MKAVEEFFDNISSFSNLSLNKPGTDEWVKTEKGYTTRIKTIGISPEDVKVVLEADKNVIKVSGKTEFRGYVYETAFDVPLSDAFTQKIESMDYETKDGLTYICVHFE